MHNVPFLEKNRDKMSTMLNLASPLDCAERTVTARAVRKRRGVFSEQQNIFVLPARNQNDKKPGRIWTFEIDVAGRKGLTCENFEKLAEDVALNPTRLRMFISIR